MNDKFEEVFFKPHIIEGYNRLLLGESELDQLAFMHYADLFYNLGSVGRKVRDFLDLGAGPGYLGAEIAKRIERGNIYFLDKSPAMIEKARMNVNKRFSDNGALKFNYIIDDAANLLGHCPEGSIDLIIARYLVDIPEDPTMIFEHAYKALRANGKFIFTLPGYNIFNFSKTGNSLFENKFFLRLTQACFQVLPQYVAQLPQEAIKYLQDKGVVELKEKDVSMKADSLYPRHNKKTIMDRLANAGVPLSKITYLILTEHHTVEFKQKFSLVLGTTPIPPSWEILPLFDEITRYTLIHKIYDKAFPGDKNIPVQTHDPVFIVRK